MERIYSLERAAGARAGRDLERSAHRPARRGRSRQARLRRAPARQRFHDRRDRHQDRRHPQQPLPSPTAPPARNRSPPSAPANRRNVSISSPSWTGAGLTETWKAPPGRRSRWLKPRRPRAVEAVVPGFRSSSHAGTVPMAASCPSLPSATPGHEPTTTLGLWRGAQRESSGSSWPIMAGLAGNHVPTVGFTDDWGRRAWGTPCSTGSSARSMTS